MILHRRFTDLSDDLDAIADDPPVKRNKITPIYLVKANALARTCHEHHAEIYVAMGYRRVSKREYAAVRRRILKD